MRHTPGPLEESGTLSRADVQVPLQPEAGSELRVAAA